VVFFRRGRQLFFCVAFFPLFGPERLQPYIAALAGALRRSAARFFLSSHSFSYTHAHVFVPTQPQSLQSFQIRPGLPPLLHARIPLLPATPPPKKQSKQFPPLSQPFPAACTKLLLPRQTSPASSFSTRCGHFFPCPILSPLPSIMITHFSLCFAQSSQSSPTVRPPLEGHALFSDPRPSGSVFSVEEVFLPVESPHRFFPLPRVSTSGGLLPRCS